MIHYQAHGVTLHHGDALAVLATLPDNSVDAVVTDPPYGLEFMGKEWDQFRQQRDPRTAGRSSAGPVIGGAAVKESSNAGGGARVSFGGNRPTTYRCDTCGKRDQFRNHHSPRFPGWCQGTWNREVIDPNAPSPLLPFQQWCTAWAAECLRVLKPGGHLLAFGGTRTAHRLTSGIEDAGFEIRDSVAWLYGSGFPKSLDVSKAIDKRKDWTLVGRLAGEIRRARAEAGLSLTDIGEATLTATAGAYGKWYHRGGHMFFETGRSLPSRPEWDQLRHILPIAAEFVAVYDEAERSITQHQARPGVPGDVITFDQRASYERERRDIPATPEAARWAGFGTALKPAHEPVTVARKPLQGTVAANVLAWGTGAINIDAGRIGTEVRVNGPASGGYMEGWGEGSPKVASGRWPANVALDESAAAELDTQSGDLHSGANPTRRGSDKFRDAYGDFAGQAECTPARGADSGGASRFLYVAKADADERPRVNGTSHPTVKPLALMRWLVRMFSPPGGLVLDPFAGSGTTAEACLLEGMRCVTIEREADYLPFVVARVTRQRDPVAHVALVGDRHPTLFDPEGDTPA